jgi:hypothetical protein
MLLAVGLVAQWDVIVSQLPSDWRELGVKLRLARPNDVTRAAALLGSLSPGVAGAELHLRATPGGEAGPRVVRRHLARLDEQGIRGTLELASTDVPAAAKVATQPEAALSNALTASLAAAWDELVAVQPEDWSDLLAVVELRSSDELAPAALALAPLNPSRHKGSLAFRFRVARRFGYGAAPQMARRCLERLDELGIPGELRLLDVLSDTQPVLTQGPTFVVSDRAV